MNCSLTPPDLITASTSIKIPLWRVVPTCKLWQ